MPTECIADLFGFTPVEGRRVVAAFDGGRMTSDAGAMLLSATERVIDVVGRFAGCFADYRAPELIEHEVRTLVGQRVYGIALGYEDLIDHEELRHDPVKRCWPASWPRGARTAHRWRARARSTGWS